jgi:hypothetical protein
MTFDLDKSRAIHDEEYRGVAMFMLNNEARCQRQRTPRDIALDDMRKAVQDCKLVMLEAAARLGGALPARAVEFDIREACDLLAETTVESFRRTLEEMGEPV